MKQEDPEPTHIKEEQQEHRLSQEDPPHDQPLSVHPDCSAAVERPYQCKQCGNSFTRKGHLTIHSRTHTGENPYQCKQCGKRFNQKSNLTIHTRVHTGENPYQCKQCGKMFNQKGHLTVHSRIHTGERPYQCKDFNFQWIPQRVSFRTPRKTLPVSFWLSVTFCYFPLLFEQHYVVL
uniref:C2H2-type domain-containing protein n=1 Tax=Oncorhynchus tshawytscha TaxID=74940 RepID=A0A8C8CGH1_ONCTS